MPHTTAGPSSSRPIQQRASAAARPRNAVAAQQQQQAAAQQPPWRSSLDLVWSYSRSQAFYSHNLETSPSFTDARWRGPQYEVTPETLEEGEEEDEEYDWEQGEGESDAGEDVRGRRSSEQDADHLFPHTGPVWTEDSTPYSTTASTGSGSSKIRRLRQVAAEGSDSDDRNSRSRSRSPKKLDISRTAMSNSRSERRTSGLSRRSDDPGSVRSADIETSPQAPSNERTPLLGSRERRKSRSSFHGPGLGRRKSSGFTATPKFPAGSSTFGQSLFNCINALVGIGILSLPLALSYASFTLGVPIFLAAGLVTSYTGKLLWKMMRLDPRLRSYSDIGRYAFGDKAQIGISLLFGAELWAVSVALIVLFGDSLYAMVHSNMRPSHVQTFVVASGIATWSPSAFKVLGFFLVLPTVFVPLRFLSPISVIGILSTVTVLVILVTDGFLKPDYPGSLHHPAATLWPPEPPQWSKIPLSFGLIMSGFASHAIVPAIIRDMKEPERFPAMLNTAYVVATAIYLTMGITGYLMFGKGVSDEITRDVAQTKAYPQLLTKIAVWLIVVVPLTKFALASRPVLGIFEGLLGVEEPQTIAEAEGHNEESNTMAGRVAEELEQDIDDAHRPQGTLKQQSGSHISLNGVAPADPSRLPPPPSSISPRLRIVLRNLLRLVLTALILLTAIVFPEFERIMAFLGAFLAFTTCVIGPIMAHLKLFRAELSTRRIVCEIVLLSISFVCAITGTVWAFLPL